MNSGQKRSHAWGVVVCLALTIAVASGPMAADDQQTTGDFNGCPPTGKGGDPDQNTHKNRDVPPASYQDMALADVLKNTPSAAWAMGTKHRAEWTAEAKASVADWESKALRIEGRLIAVRRPGPEACNCDSSTDVDHHLWIALRPASDAKATESMVVEISPRTLGAHPGWDMNTLIDLAKQGAQVRISGWVTWDEEHGDEVGKSRGTLWEIHPIHLIEVFQNGAWQDIDKK